MIEGIAQLDDLVAHVSSVHRAVSARIEFFRKGAYRSILTLGVVDKPALNGVVAVCRAIGGVAMKELPAPSPEIKADVGVEVALAYPLCQPCESADGLGDHPREVEGEAQASHRKEAY